MVGVHEAKNKLSELLDRVEAGETIGLTRPGRQVAVLAQVHQQQSSAIQCIARIRQLRVGSRLRGVSVRQLRDEGRR